MSAQFNFFGATAAEVLHEFKGAVYTDFDTSSGSGDGEAEVTAALERAEDVLLAYLPPRYRRLLTRVEGEIVEEYADEDQADVTLFVSVASPAALRLWRNWPHRGVMSPANREITSGSGIEWELTGQTVTFSPPLARGDSIIASYDADATAWDIPLLARQLVLVAAFSLADRVFGDGDSGWKSARAGFDSALALLRDLRDGRAGIAEFENLELIEGSGEKSAGRGSTRRLGRA